MAKNVEDTGARCDCCWGLKVADHRKETRLASFCGRLCLICGITRPTGYQKFLNSIVEIDRAMRLGFNWELGPFELWDAAGVETTVARMKKDGKPVAANVERLLASGQKSWYADDPKTVSGRKYWDLASGNWQPVSSPRRSVVGHGRQENRTAW